jgi:hypothetical protein
MTWTVVIALITAWLLFVRWTWSVAEADDRPK